MDDPLKGQTFQNPQAQTSQPSPTPQVAQPEPVYQSSSVPTVPPASQQTSPPRFSIGNILKLLIGLLAVLLIAFVIVGVVLPNLNKKEEKVELTLWDLSDGSTIGNTFPEFERQNPGIKVNLVKQEIKDYKDRLITRINNGTGPDLFRFHNTWVLQLSNLILPLPSDVITKDVFNKTYYPVAKHDLIKNGAIYGLPLEIDTLSLFVNSALISDAKLSVPTNWNDFITTSRALTLKDQAGKIKTAGAGIGTFDNVTHAPDIVSALFAQDSVNLDDISQTKERVADALNFYTGFAISEGSVWDSTLDPTILAFSKGNLAMYFGYFKDQAVIKSSNSSLSFDIVSIPHLSGQNQTIASYYPVGVSIRSKHQKEALLLMKYLTGKAAAEGSTTLPSARVDVADKSKGQSKDAVSSLFVGETFDNGLNSELNTHLATAISSILSGGTSATAADNLILGFSQVIKKFVPSE